MRGPSGWTKTGNPQIFTARKTVSQATIKLIEHAPPVATTMAALGEGAHSALDTFLRLATIIRITDNAVAGPGGTQTLILTWVLTTAPVSTITICAGRDRTDPAQGVPGFTLAVLLALS